MKKIIFSVLGALVFALLCIGSAWLLGALLGPLFQGEEESTANFKIFLFILLVSTVVGAVLGFLFGKSKTGTN